MPNLISHFLISLDGVVESPDRWSSQYFNEEMGAEVAKVPEEMGAMMMGRVLYEEWSRYWPSRGGENAGFADFINNVPKYVVSTTLENPEWHNTTVIGLDGVAALKEQPGKSIGMSGSPTLVRSLLKAGLLDELRLSVFPIVVGSGARLFDGLTDRVPLQLTDTRPTSTGVLNLRYRRA
jgi:dihydrofolate reductase